MNLENHMLQPSVMLSQLTMPIHIPLWLSKVGGLTFSIAYLTFQFSSSACFLKIFKATSSTGAIISQYENCLMMIEKLELLLSTVSSSGTQLAFTDMDSRMRTISPQNEVYMCIKLISITENINLPFIVKVEYH